jgi:hypothetical protein
VVNSVGVSEIDLLQMGPAAAQFLPTGTKCYAFTVLGAQGPDSPPRQSFHFLPQVPSALF